MPTKAKNNPSNLATGGLADQDAQSRLEYLADILRNLQSLSQGAAGATLTGLLALAHKEALLESKRVSRNED